MTAYIDNKVINDQSRGLAVSFAEAAAALPPGHGANYLTARKIADMGSLYSSSVRATRRQEREKIAAPETLALFNGFPQGPGIIADGITVKKPGSLIVGVPECFDFTLPLVTHCASDALYLRGAKAFESSELVLVIHRADVKPDDAHRPDFANWHNHLQSPLGDIDLIYGFSDKLPTEFQIADQAIAAPQNSLTRFGTEFIHRSQTNKTGATVPRVWGALMVVDNSLRNTPSFNIATDKSHQDEFIQAARHYLESAPLKITPISQPLAPRTSPAESTAEHPVAELA